MSQMGTYGPSGGGGGGPVTKFTADTGTATPLLGNINLLGGLNVSTVASGDTITINSNANSQIVHYQLVTFGMSPYTVVADDYYISVATAGGAITIKLPDSPDTGRIFLIKDRDGDAAASAITVTTVSGTDLIDGATSFSQNTAYESVGLLFNGTNYEIY